MHTTLFLSFEQSLVLFLQVDVFSLRLVALLNVLTSGLEGLSFLVPLFDLLVVFEVAEELTPCNEFFVVNRIILLVELHHFIHFVALDLIEDLVQGHDLVLLTSNTYSLGINKVNDFHVHAQMLDKLSTLQNTIFVLVKILILLFHGFDLRWKQKALGLLS